MDLAKGTRSVRTRLWPDRQGGRARSTARGYPYVRTVAIKVMSEAVRTPERFSVSQSRSPEPSKSAVHDVGKTGTTSCQNSCRRDLRGLTGRLSSISNRFAINR